MSLDNIKPCQWCGHIHGDLCPQVKAFEYAEDGAIRRVEFFSPVDRMHPDLVEAARRIIEHAPPAREAKP